MNATKPSRTNAVAALLATLIVFGCGADKPESMLASAKDFLAKNDNKAAVIQLKNALQNNPNLGEARFLLGKALLDGGNPTAAEVELRKAKELDYSADQVTPVLASALLMLGQARKITDDLAKIQLTSPESKADLQTTVGHANLMMGKIESAQSAYATALTAFPDYAPALVGQARIRAGKRDLPGALTVLDTALEKSPRHYEAWQLKADILYAQGNAKESLAAYRKTLEIKPDLVPAHSALISRLLDEGLLDDAGKQLDEMKIVAPKNPQTTYLQAQLLYRQKNFAAAQESIQQYLKSVPDSTMGLQLAGAIAYELKAYSLAESYLLKALPKTPELGMARRILIASYLRSGQPAKALAILQVVLGRIENNSNMLSLAGEVFMQNGDATRAGIYFTKAAALDPENTGKRTSVALSHLAKGEGDTAYRELEQIALVDTGIKADLALIATHMNRRQFDQAFISIDALEKKQPENPLADSLRGTALLGKGDVAAARISFEHALVKNPVFFPAAASLANLDLLDKKPDEAKKRFDRLLTKDPRNLQALLALAELRAKTGGPLDEVAALINKAISANPGEAAPRIALIQVYLGAKDSKKALSAAQEALGVFPDRPDVLEAAGRAQQAAGDFNQALATYGKLAALTPGSPQPHLRMAEIQMAAKNNEAAMQSLRKALTIKADSIEAQRGIMMLDLDSGRTAEALATARQIQKQRPQEAVGFALEGDAHGVKKAWSEAATAYRSGLKQNASTELAVKLHAALTASGASGEADKFAENWLREHAQDLQFRLYLAEAANARKDYAAASKHYRVLLEAQPNNAAVLNNLAWSSAKNKDPKAIEYAEKAYALAPDQPAIIDTLGELLLQKGDTARALELLLKAASLAPKNTQIQFNLARALVKAGKKDEAKKELDQLAKLGDKFSAQADVAKMLQGL
jgi:putative PEP-CTERM system TPR-repeat lipoprotein